MSKTIRYPTWCEVCEYFNISATPYEKNPLRKSCDYKWERTGDVTVSQNGRCNTFERIKVRKTSP